VVKVPEYRGKEILREYGIRTPRSVLISLKDLDNIYFDKFPCVIKAQALTTGRMKKGLIDFAENIDDLNEKVKRIAEKRGEYIFDKILIEEMVRAEREMYAGIIVNPSYKSKSPEIIFSIEGGIDVEEIAEKRPEAIVRLTVDYLEGFDEEEFYEALNKFEIDEELKSKITDFINKLYKIFVNYYAKSIEVNPLFLKGSEMIAGDCKIVVDDASIFKLGWDVFPIEMDREPTELERKAWKIEENDYRGTAYFIQLTLEEPKDKRNGYIAFHGIGGGASMLAADVLMKKGFILANYADTSGNPPASKIYRIVKICLSQKGIEGYTLMGAVFASQEQWHHAHAIVKAFKEFESEKTRGFPVIILLAGNKEKESLEILNKHFRNMNYQYEIYGREYIYELDYIADRLKEMIERYREMRGL